MHRRLNLSSLCFLLATLFVINSAWAQNPPGWLAKLQQRVPMKVQTNGTWPQARGYTSLVYDPFSEDILMLSGQAGYGWSSGLPGNGGVWSFKPGSGTWKRLNNNVPTQLDGAAYDVRARRIIAWVSYVTDPESNFILAPIQLVSQTWAFDPQTGIWENRHPINSPPPGLLGGGWQIVYDTRSDRTIMFGGLDLALFEQYLESCGPNWDTCDDSLIPLIETNHTWAYDYSSNRWTDMTPQLSPPARNSNALVYDQAASRVILFGGGDFFVDYNDTWAYDFGHNSWRQLNPATVPPARAYGYLAYNSESDRIVLFGGVDYTETQIFGDTWIFNYWNQTWTQMNPRVSPPPRGWFGIVYSAAANRVVTLGGGTDRDQFTDETWTYRIGPNKWDQITPP